jgi:hypothetical protein
MPSAVVTFPNSYVLVELPTLSMTNVRNKSATNAGDIVPCYISGSAMSGKSTRCSLNSLRTGGIVLRIENYANSNSEIQMSLDRVVLPTITGSTNLNQPVPATIKYVATDSVHQQRLRMVQVVTNWNPITTATESASIVLPNNGYKATNVWSTSLTGWTTTAS